MLVLNITTHPEILVYYDCLDGDEIIGGEFAGIYPGGSFHGMSYQELHKLGNGSHNIVVDEHVINIDGDVPVFSEAEKMLNHLRFALFDYHVEPYMCTEVNVLRCALFAMTPSNIENAYLLLPEEWRLRMFKFAKTIPGLRQQGGCRFFGSNGPMETIPDENLLAVQKWFEAHRDHTVKAN